MTKTNFEIVGMFQFWCTLLEIFPFRIEAQSSGNVCSDGWFQVNCNRFDLNLLQMSYLEAIDTTMFSSSNNWLLLSGICWQENEATYSVHQRSTLKMLWLYVLIIRPWLTGRCWPGLLFLWYLFYCRAFIYSPDTLGSIWECIKVVVVVVAAMRQVA